MKLATSATHPSVVELGCIHKHTDKFMHLLMGQAVVGGAGNAHFSGHCDLRVEVPFY